MNRSFLMPVENNFCALTVAYAVSIESWDVEIWSLPRKHKLRVVRGATRRGQASAEDR